MDYDKAVKVLNMVIANSVRGEEAPLVEKTVEDISKIVYEELMDSHIGRLKIFYRSTSRQGNNKPYTFNKPINKKQFDQIHLAKQIVYESMNEADTLDSLFDEAVPTEETVDTKKIVKNDTDSIPDKPSDINDEVDIEFPLDYDSPEAHKLYKEIDDKGFSATNEESRWIIRYNNYHEKKDKGA